jgi:hypothetical protein
MFLLMIEQVYQKDGIVKRIIPQLELLNSTSNMELIF